MRQAKVVCGHFQTHWTILYCSDGVRSAEYCNDCRLLVRALPGSMAAAHMQEKTALEAQEPRT